MKRLCMGCMEEYDDRLAFCSHCGYPFQKQPDQPYYLMPGTVLQQRYIVGRVLGCGGFGIIYIGWDYLLERKVAIKEYFPREYVTRMMNQSQVVIYSGEREHWYQKGLQKVLDEAKRLAKFEAVSGIVQIYDCFAANGTSYIMMELLEGMTLKDYLERNGPMEEKRAIAVILQIAWAMETVHAAGILHRDISPDNIYVLNPDSSEALKVKLLDFGAARYAAATQEERSLSVIVKPGYAPEEQYRRHGEQGPWTDVYGLAATLYKMLTGLTPENALERGVKDELKRPSELGFSLSRSTEAALMNALKMAVPERTQSMEEFARELRSDHVKERRSKPSRAVQGGMLTAMVGFCLVCLIGVAIAFSGRLLTGERQDPDSALQMVRVPNLINLDVEEAERRLAQQGLYLSQESADFSDEVEEGKISYQEQKEGTVIEQGAEIQVTVSLGKERYQLPPVLGLSGEEAVKTLEVAGFQDVTTVDSQEEGAYDTVIAVTVNGEIQEETSQDEPFNLRAWLERLEQETELVEVDAKIQLTICKKEAETAVEMAVVPDLENMNVGEACEILEEAGFHPNLIVQYSYLPEGTVLRQEPEAGEEPVAEGYVDLWVSRGEEPILMPDLRMKELEEAEEIIEEMGMVLADVQESYDSSVSEGRVITQNIEPDTEVSTGQRIMLKVSMGRMRETEEFSPTTKVPSRTTAPETAAHQPITQPTIAPPSEETSAQEPEEEGTDESLASPGPMTPTGQSWPGFASGLPSGGNTGESEQNTGSLSEGPGDVSGFEKPSID